MSTNTKRPTMRPRTPPGAQTSSVVPVAIVPKLNRSSDQDAMEAALALTANQHDTKPSGFEAAELSRTPTTYSVGQNYKLPLQMFQRSENNARVFYRTQELDEMSRSLERQGQDYPTLGYVRGNKVVLTDGQKRFQAAVNAGLFELEVKIIAPPSSEAEEYEKSRRVNLERSTQSGLDDAFKWKALMDRGVYKSQDELAASLDLKKEKVSKVLSITRIPERLVRTMIEYRNTSSWSTAYLVSTIFDPRRIEEEGADKVELLAQEILDEIIKKEMNRNQVEALISKKLQGPKKRSQPETLPVKYGDFKGEIKTFPGRGQLDMTFRGLPEEKISLLRETLEKVLSGQMPLA